MRLSRLVPFRGEQRTLSDREVRKLATTLVRKALDTPGEAPFPYDEGDAVADALARTLLALGDLDRTAARPGSHSPASTNRRSSTTANTCTPTWPRSRSASPPSRSCTWWTRLPAGGDRLSPLAGMDLVAVHLPPRVRTRGEELLADGVVRRLYTPRRPVPSSRRPGRPSQPHPAPPSSSP